MLEGGSGLLSREIPATLHDSLMERLDRLGLAKEVAQVAAVIGREFSYELLRAVSTLPEHQLRSGLEKLIAAELIYERQSQQTGSYLFKHALIQDAAYEALLKSKRRELHRDTAQAIAGKFAAFAEAQPEVLAHHWSEAAEAEQAIDAWTKAGRAAGARRAFKEAEQAYRQALAMLDTLPSSAKRDVCELELVNSLAQALQLTRGYTAPETVDAIARARVLAEKCGDTAQQLMQKFGSWVSTVISGDYAGARLLSDQLLELARAEGSPTSLAFAYLAHVHMGVYRGDFVSVEEYFELLRSLPEASSFSPFPGAVVTTIGFASAAAWNLGYPDRARKRMNEGIEFALSSGNPYDLAFIRWFDAWLYTWVGEPSQADAAASAAIALAEEHGFPFLRELAQSVRAWAQTQLGDVREGVSRMRQSMESLAQTGNRWAINAYLSYLAEAQTRAGLLSDALDTIEMALQINPDEQGLRPEILRRRAEVRLRTGATDLAEADLREAIALAHEAKGKAWELRAATSLARSLKSRGELLSAREVLTSVYGWFTEGFETADLKDAKALLDELSAELSRSGAQSPRC